MSRAAVLIAAAALLGCSAPSVAQQQPPVLQWTVDDSGSLKADPAKVQFQVSYREGGSHTIARPPAPLPPPQGLTEAQLAAPASGQVRFRVDRDAGDFQCEGVARDRRGSGFCDFVADPRFADELARRAIGRPTEAE